MPGDGETGSPAAAAARAAASSAAGSSKLAWRSNSSMDAWSISESAAALLAGEFGSGPAFGGCSAAIRSPSLASQRGWRNDFACQDMRSKPRLSLPGRLLEVRPERDALGHQHFLDHSFADDRVELVFHLP